jgi:SNF2 family DNA or RNA helicase
MKSLRYSDKWSYKIARRISRIEPVSLETVNTNIPVNYYTADAVQYSFPPVFVNHVSMLERAPVDTIETDTFSFIGNDTIPIDLLKDVTVSQADTYWVDVPTISENLFVPLGRQHIKGKNYRKNQQEEQSGQKTLFPDFQRQERTEKGLRKSFQEINKSTRKFPDLWDMLFPILQPPIAEAFSDLLDLPPLCEQRPYQWDGIKFLVEREAALLGDDMGTGKTFQSILAARFLFQRDKVKRALILSPVSVLPTWVRELEKWAPSLLVTFVRGNPDTRQTRWDMPAHIWVTTYDTLRQDIDYLKAKSIAEFDLVILDEAQKIKNRNAGLSMAVRQLHTKYRWGLSGTPLENKIEDLAAIFAFLKPKLFPKTFSPTEASLILQPYFLRRRKADVLKGLPPLQILPPVPIYLTDEQQQTYDTLEKERVVELYQKGKTITAQNILTLIMELKKVCNRDPDTGKSAKLDWLLENLEDMTGEDNKVLVFTQFRVEDCGGSEWLEDNLSEYGALNYCRATTDRSKHDLLKQFANDTDKKVFIGNPRTAGLGLNELTCANYVVHFDHWWNPAVTNQATARAHRPGQKKEVFVYHLWVEDTIEQMILDKTLAKQRLYDEVIDSLSSGISEDVLFDVYDDLLVKYGFQPLHLGKKEATGIEKPPKQDDAKTNRRIQDPREFEKVIARLFEAMGYKAQLTPYSRDGGVDVIASRASGYSVEKIAIQCKLQSGPVGRPVIQQLLGVISSDTTYSKGYLVTNNDISRDAYDLLQTNGRLGAITGNELKRQLEKYGLSMTF